MLNIFITTLGESVVLVNTRGKMIGTMEKMAAHRKGRLHRAFSIFIFNSKGQLLLQQRAKGKYHSGGLWTNSCCSHPGLGEATEVAVHRRLQQEMGLDCPLRELFTFSYRHEFENGLIEHEFDHVFIGFTDKLPVPDPEEAMGFRYIDPQTLLADISNHPDQYTAWLKICLSQVLEMQGGAFAEIQEGI